MLLQGSVEARPDPAALYALLGCGVVLVLVMAVLLLRKRAKDEPPEPRWKPIVAGVLGFALLGVGAFGPRFLTDYGDFLTELMNATGREKEALYADVMRKTATGELPENVESAAKAYMLQNPVPDMEDLARAQIPVATPEGRKRLEAFSEEVERSERTAKLAAEGAVREVGRIDDLQSELMRLDSRTLHVLEVNPAIWPDLLETRPGVIDDVLRTRVEPFRDIRR